MPHILSSKFDTTLRYASGLYGLATSVLEQITQAAEDAVAALAAATTATSTANAASSTASAASTAATSATSTANAASTAAGNASTAADAATSTANSALSTANAASSTANAASSTASAASSTANAASSTASAASTAAGNATTTANATASSLTAHVGSGGAAHALASGSANGFMSTAQFNKVAALAAGQPVTLGRVTVDAVLETPTGVYFDAAFTDLDVSVKNDFRALDTLRITGSTIRFLNPAAGQQGFVAVRQNDGGTGDLTIQAPAGWTIYRDANTPDLQPSYDPDAVTIYTYAFVTVTGLNVLFIGKLTPVAA